MVAKRALKGFISGALGSMVAVSSVAATNAIQLENWFISLLIAGLTGGVGGALLALEKYFQPDKSNITDANSADNNNQTKTKS